jgi:hypothetical protein
MKTLRTLLVVVMMTNCILPSGAQGVQKIDGIYYEFHEFHNGVRNVACVSNGRNKEGDVTIPPSVIYRSTSYTVTEINGAV